MSRSLDEESGVVPIGRPREFDTSKAMDSAMLLFWRNGYEGTSISDLTETLGITRPSLYAAFGNKEQLFRIVFWTATTKERRNSLPGRSTFRQCAKSPKGCCAGPLTSTAIRRTRQDVSWFMARSSAQTNATLCGGKRVTAERGSREAITASDSSSAQRSRRAILPARADPEALARYIVAAVMRGMAVEAASGAKGRDLHQIVDHGHEGLATVSKRRAERR